MNTAEIKSDIKDQIAKTNRSFGKNGRLGVKYPTPEEIDLLERDSKKFSTYFKIYLIGALVLSGILLIVSLLKTFKMLDSFDLNKNGLVIIFAIAFGINTLAYYKVKVNLENKIYLLRLLNKIK